MSSYGQRQAAGDDAYVHQEIQWLKQDCGMIRNAVLLLEQEKDNLRQAVRKLKLENGRVKAKVKKLQVQVKALGGKTDEDSDDDDVDYDELGKDFILVGGAQDPLSLRYEVAISDEKGNVHRSSERYYWYKMAEKFGDVDAMSKIKDAANTPKAEIAMKDIKGFNEKLWDEVKMEVWEKAQRLKLEQVKWIANVLHETGTTYIAVSHQDKQFGTGWRKNREESNKPIFWDGQNMGGKFLMKYRKAHPATYAGPSEKDDARKKYQELKRFVWRRIDQNSARRAPNGTSDVRGGAVSRGRGGGSRGGGRGGFNGGNNAIGSSRGAGDRLTESSMPYGAYHK